MAYANGRRQAVPPQAARQLKVATIPAPTRGLAMHENEAFMAPGEAIVQDNWVSTTRGVKLRGGFIRHCDLHALDTTIPPVPSTSRKPVVSAFEYVTASQQKMFAAQATKLFDVTSTTPVLVKSGQASGNYSAAQFANAGGNWMIAVNDAGDFPLQYNGTTSTWSTLSADEIHGPVGSPIEHGRNLVYVCKYRGRLFFIEQDSMNAWYLGIDSIAGALTQIPLSGAAARGGKLLFIAVFSTDAGDGLDDKICFATTEGEILIFTGSNPGEAANWRQEGRFMLSPPLGMNAHLNIGGDLLVMTVEGIIPLSQAITKEAGQLEQAMLTRAIKPMWRTEAAAKRALPWTAKKWDEYGAVFVTWPGGPPGARYCAVVNNATLAWARFVGYDALCFIKLRADLFFGNQDGIIMQADRTGLDDGKPYVATLVGGWNTFPTGGVTVVWMQARATYHAATLFTPQLAATVDFQVDTPPPPPTMPGAAVAEVWDQGQWDVMRWDQPAPVAAPIRNSYWVSIGETGRAHAPIVQVTVGQTGRPDVELIAIDATYDVCGVNV